MTSRCGRHTNPVPMGWGDHMRYQHDWFEGGKVTTNGARHSQARAGAAAMRNRAWDLQARPFVHLVFGTLGDAVQRFVPGPTWSYVPPRDRPRPQRKRCS